MFLRAKKLTSYIPEDIKEFCAKFQEKNYECYIVGGAIRDILLGYNPHEYDFTTNALPEQIEKIFEETIPTGKKYGTISVKFKDNIYEVTTFRKESNYSDQRHPDKIEFTDDIRKDLKRRDFTINAVAFSPIKNDLVDSFGGLEDLHNRILRTVGDPEQRFREDGLRVWRAMRFLARLEFAIETKTAKAIQKYTTKWSTLAAKERIITELEKLVSSVNPDYGLSFIEGLPKINKQNNAEIRLAVLCQEVPEVFELVLKKETRKRIENLIKYNFNLDNANFSVKDLAVTGIDIMELGPRGEAVGNLLEQLKEIVIDFKRLNKKVRLINVAKELVNGVEEATVREKIKAGLFN